MKKAISIVLMIALAISLAVTALAADITTPPTGENVVKLTDASNGEEYNGDIYLEFSNPVKVTTQGTDEYIEVPAGTTVTLYWFRGETYYTLAGNSVYMVHFKNGGNYVSNSENADGTISVTFDAEGDYEFEGISPVSGLWLFELTPHIHVTGSAASTEPQPASWTFLTYLVYSNAEMDIGEQLLFTVSFSKGYDEFKQLIDGEWHDGEEHEWGGEYISVFEVAAGSTVGLTLGSQYEPDTWPAEDFTCKHVNFDGSTVTDAEPITVQSRTQGDSKLFDLVEPGYYQLEGKSPEGFPWVVYHGGTLLIHVTGTAAPVDPELKPIEKFTDLPQDGNELKAVNYAVENNLIYGLAEDTFSPYTLATRGQVMTILARLNGINTGSGADWDKAGIQWAVQKGMTTNPDSNPAMTRGEVIYMLWVSYNKPAAADQSVLSKFADADKVPAEYLDAMAWAVEKNIMAGEDHGDEKPWIMADSPVQRVVLAAFLMRAEENA